MAKYNIVISGYYGFHNAGDEAMLLAILQALRKTFDAPSITVISGNPSDTAKTFGVKAVPRFGILPILSSLFRADLLISGGGSLLQDVTSWKSMIYYLTIIIFGVLFRKQVFLYSQGIGPVRYRIIRIILKHVLNHVDAITVRDSESKGFLQRLGVHRTIYTTADAVLSLEPVSLEKGKEILTRNHVDPAKKRVGIAIRSWANTSRWMKPLRAYQASHSREGLLGRPDSDAVSGRQVRRGSRDRRERQDPCAKGSLQHRRAHFTHGKYGCRRGYAAAFHDLLCFDACPFSGYLL